MWADTRLTELLGIEHPIVQAPMAGATTPAMAAAAANAGCLGSLGCAFMTPESFAAATRETRAATNRAINMNFFCHAEPCADSGRATRTAARMQGFFAEFGLGAPPAAEATNFPYGAAMHAAVIESRPAVVSFHFGLPEGRFVDELKAGGAVILSSATTPDEARDLEQRGVDAVIAQGWEAGGHHGFYLTDAPAGIGTMALVPQVVDAVSVPVIAAGGIADGRGIAAALMLGAAGVQIGTAFLPAPESSVQAPHRRALATAGGGDTRLTRAFSGRPARGIANRYLREMAGAEDDLPDFPLLNTMTAPLRKASADADSGDFLALWAGQAVGLAREGTVADIAARLVAETRTALARAGGA